MSSRIEKAAELVPRAATGLFVTAALIVSACGEPHPRYTDEQMGDKLDALLHQEAIRFVTSQQASECDYPENSRFDLWYCNAVPDSATVLQKFPVFECPELKEGGLNIEGCRRRTYELRYRLSNGTTFDTLQTLYVDGRGHLVHISWRADRAGRWRPWRDANG